MPGGDGALLNSKPRTFRGGDKAHCLMFSGHLPCVQQHHALSRGSKHSFQKNTNTASNSHSSSNLGKHPIFGDCVTSTQSPPVLYLHLLTLNFRDPGAGETSWTERGAVSSTPGHVPHHHFQSRWLSRLNTFLFKVTAMGRFMAALQSTLQFWKPAHCHHFKRNNCFHLQWVVRPKKERHARL